MVQFDFSALPVDQRQRLATFGFSNDELITRLENAKTEAVHSCSLATVQLYHDVLRDAIGIEYAVRRDMATVNTLLTALRDAFKNQLQLYNRHLEQNILYSMRAALMQELNQTNSVAILHQYYEVIDKSPSPENYDVLMMWQLIQGNTNQFSHLAENTKLLMNDTHWVRFKLPILMALSQRDRHSYITQFRHYQQERRNWYLINAKTLHRADLFDYFAGYVNSFSIAMGLL